MRDTEPSERVAPTTILLIGSFNGQESLGDHCLLGSVVSQLSRAFPEASFLAYLHNNLSQASQSFKKIEFDPGFSALFWGWANKFHRMRLPFSDLLAILTWPLYLAASTRGRATISRIWRDSGSASFLYFYGGTQLSQQWFWLNFLPLFFMLVICRTRGVPVYFGPQQYGPQKPWQRTILRTTLKYLVSRSASRNQRCAEMLGFPSERVFGDEVFGCLELFPLTRSSAQKPKFVLINVRGENFYQEMGDVEFAVFEKFLIRLQSLVGLPFWFFQMSQPSFCDDTRFLDILRAKKSSLEIETLPSLKNGKELFQLAQLAYGCVSMSFHGCILSLMAGCPAVPVRSGFYYEYKYCDFAKYQGGQEFPVLDLDRGIPQETPSRVQKYFEDYRPDLTLEVREQFASELNDWYAGIRTDLKAPSDIRKIHAKVKVQRAN